MGLRQSKSKTKATAASRYMTTAPEESTSVKRYSPVHSDAVLSVGCAGEDIFLSGSADQSIVLYQWQEGRMLQKWTGHDRDVTKVTYSPCMDYVFSGSRDKTARMWKRDGAVGSTILQSVLQFVGHQLVVTGLAPVEVTKRLCTGGRDNSVRLWDTETGGCIKEASTSRNLVTHMVTIPNTETILQSSEDKSIRIWDSRTLEECSASNKKNQIQTCCDVSLDGNLCLSCSNGFGGQGCEASLWDVRSLRDPIREFKGHHQTVGACAFLRSRSSRSKQMFVTCSHDQTVKLWDQNSGDCLCTLSLPGSKQLTSLAISPNDSICVGSFETGVHILSLEESAGGFELREVCQY